MNKQLEYLPIWFKQGEVYAYPTEAVFGLGCDPQNKEAVYKILDLKKRPVEKGMILIASDIKQIEAYLHLDKLPDSTQKKIVESWPGPVTWLLPKSDYTPKWVSGASDMVAVRITAHPLVRAMCEQVNSAMISTSANPATEPPAKSVQEVKDYFADSVHIVEGDLGEQSSPSKIFHSLTLETIRA